MSTVLVNVFFVCFVSALGQCSTFGIMTNAPAQTVGESEMYQNDAVSNSVYDKGNPQQQTRNISFI
jgi:hypothetical protein